MANDLNRNIKIYIDGTEAVNNVKTVETSIQRLEAKLAALTGSEADYNTKSKQLQKSIQDKNATLKKYNKGIEETNRVLKNLSGATYNELLSVQSKVRKELRNAIPDTQQYNAALEQNRRVTEALTRSQNAMRVEVGSQGTTWSKAAGFVNKYMALIGGVVASITGISMTIRRSVEDYAQISEAMAGVKKYTGMTDQAVRELNESFKSMDTRTPRERLNELAQDAGRLGIKGKQDIIDFVDAANTINVALGEDLGQDAVKNIGKLAQMFGDDQKIGLRAAMLATGSAINEVAQNSSAAESYLVDFTARVAGTGKQAGITQAQIMGFASVLDQDMQQVEMAATALQTVMMKVYQEPATFAKMAGKDVKEFTQLLKTDANEAILTLLQNLGSKGGLQELAPLFKDMKLDGVRASGVINTLASNVSRVRQEQERATAAYKDGTSVINEFNVQNNTVQAKLEKAKKGFQEISYELGEKLSPYMTHLITTTGLLVKGMNMLIGVIIKYSGVILTLVVSIGTYTLAVKLLALHQQKANSATLAGIIASKASVALHKIKLSATIALSAAKFLLAGNTEMATIAMQRFNAVSKGNLIGIIASVAVAAAMAIYKLATRTTEAQEAASNFITESTKERNELKKLTDAAQSAGDGTERRNKLIYEINSKYGQYLSNLLDEKSSLNDIKRAYKEINTAMEQNIANKIMDEKIEEISRETMPTKIEQMKDIREILSATLPQSQVVEITRKIDEITKKNIEAGRTTEQVAKSLFYGIKQIYYQGSGLSSDMEGELKDYAKLIDNELKRVKKVKDEMAAYVPNLGATNQTPEVTITATDLSKKKKDTVINPTVTTPTGTNNDKALEADRKSIKEFEALRGIELSNQKRAHDSIINAYRQMLSEKRLTQAQYDLFTASAQKQNADTLLNIEQTYHTKSTDLQITDKELKENNTSSSAKRVEQAEQQSFNARISAEQTYYKNLSAMRDMVQEPTLSPEDKLKAQYDIQNTLLESIYSASLNYARKNGQDESEVEQAHLAAQRSLYEKYCSDKIEIANKARLKMSDFMGDELSQEIATIYDSVTNLQLIFEHFAEADFWKRFKDSIIQNLGTIASATTKSLNSAFSTFQQIEINNIDRRYNTEIAAAEGNSEEVERIEKEKAQKKLDIEKKYADVQFAIKASEIVANTALSIMQAYGQLGPIAGSIAAAILVATGAVQLAAANSERDKVKGMTLEGSASGSNAPKTAQVQVSQWATGRYDVIGQDDGRAYNNVPYIGPAPTGIVRRTSLVSENGAELIVNAEDLSRLQKHIDYPVVVQAIQDSRSGRVPQRAEGNYKGIDSIINENETISDSVSGIGAGLFVPALAESISELAKIVKTMRDQSNKPQKSYVVLRDLHEAEELDRKSKQPFTRSKQ